MSLVELTARELLDRLSSGDTTAQDVAQAFLGRIDRHDPAIHAFLRVHRQQALDQAAQIDERRRRGKTVGPLAGLPIALKDVLCTAGEVTTCGSRMLERFVPPYDATAVARLKAADAVILGKTNMDEFAMGASCENSAFGPTRSPWDLTRIPGGSSGGSAAAVAASMAPLALGSDTGGSIRQPAALCGLTGLKPTYGRVSRYGLVAFASSLDQVGPMAWTAEDVALVLEAIAGHDPLDSTSVPRDVPKYSQTVGQPLQGLRLGVAREHYGPGLNDEVEAAVREALRVYQSLGAKLVDISLPHAKYAVATYYVIAPCEASSNLARYDGAHYGHRAAANVGRIVNPSGTGSAVAAADIDSPLVRMYRDSRSEGFGPEVKRRIMLGTYALSAGYYEAFYLKALKVRRLIRRDYDEAFGQVDLIAGPVTPDVAFPIGEKSDDPLAMYLVDLYTVSANLTGVPGISISCGRNSAGLPIGLQLQAPPLEEERLLRAAHMYQTATDWHRQRPTMAAK